MIFSILREFLIWLQFSQKKVNADLDIIIPSALFHDTIIYKKNSQESFSETEESASVAKRILESIENYPKEKIPLVESCIKECSFSKGIPASTLESQVLQDADRLEAVGAIAIMRTFSSGGQMNIPFYPTEDPLCERSVIRFRSDIDLFRERLLVVQNLIHTDYGKKIAKQRTKFLEKFLQQLKRELREAKVI